MTTLKELLVAFGQHKVVEPVVDLSTHNALQAEYADGDVSPHGRPWHTCLAGDTEVVTRQGIRAIRDLVGTAELLVPATPKNDGSTRSGRGQRTRSYRSASFVDVPVRSFGVQPVYKVKLRRGRQVKVVTATGPHRWQLKDTSVVTTDDLAPGMKLKSVRAKTGPMNMVPFAVAQGFVFGDGTARRGRRDTAWVDIHHNGKDEAMLKFFAGHQTREFDRTTGNNMHVTQVLNLPRTWKKLPDFDESQAFLLSWLAGYFAADGCVTTAGQATLTSASLEAIDCARSILSICGISYGQIVASEASGRYPNGDPYKGRMIYSLNIRVRDLPDWFFVQDKHRLRAEEKMQRPAGSLHDWEVVAVVAAGREEVFCPTTPSGFFALSDELLTGNSFHASSFPGDALQACGRQAMYGLMDIPGDGPMTRWLKSVTEVGKAVELTVVRAVRNDGRLVRSGQPGRSSDPDARDENGRPMPQMGFVDAEHWLTGSVDLPLLAFNYQSPHIVEIKSKHASRVEQMQAGDRGPDEKHRRQLLCSLGLAHENPDAFLHPQTGEVMEPAIDGSIYYLARDSDWPGPIPTHEFYFSYDPGFMEQGRAHLKKWREFFLEGRLPEETPRKNARSHPFGWRWSEGVCKFCPLKKICKTDYENGTTQLKDSVAIDYAKSVRNHYDAAQKRAAVLGAWDEDDPLADGIQEPELTTTAA